MYKKIDEILGSNKCNIIKVIDKGWSNDKKYYIETNNGKRLLLRISDISHFEKKKQEYEAVKKLDDFDILMSRPIDFGACNDGKEVYSLLTWIDGNNAEEILPTLSNEEQYKLGLKAGKVLRKIHQISPLEDQIPWEERFNCKIDRNIKAYQTCEIKFKDADKIISYINNNRYLLKNRQQSFQHGDYHVGNMIVSRNGEIGIIDFNRLDYGDPWEEFNRITWCADVSKLFASGRINGYFNGDVPDSFFKLMALYIGSNQLSSVPWAIKFGQTQVDIMIEQAQKIIKSYNGFQTYIPNWYVPNYND